MQTVLLVVPRHPQLLEATPYNSLIGPTILPVLGAVPDAAIVFFSGMGSNAQTQLDTGMGALAGSTVMLLTIPWVSYLLLAAKPRGAGADGSAFDLPEPLFTTERNQSNNHLRGTTQHTTSGAQHCWRGSGFD